MDLLRVLKEEGLAVVDARDAKTFAMALVLAAERGHTNNVRCLLDRGVSVDAPNSERSTALHVSATAGRLEIVELLLNTGAAVDRGNSKSYTPLMLATREGHTDVVQALLSRHAALELRNNKDGTALSLAVQCGRVAVTRLLLSAGAKVDTMDNEGMTPLMFASRNGQLALVELLVTRDARLDMFCESGHTALHLAAENGRLEVVQELLSSGADLMARDQVAGLTPLMYAASLGHAYIVEELLPLSFQHEIDAVEIKSKEGCTALYLAASRQHKAVCELLLDVGRASVDAAEWRGYTPLMAAAKRGFVDIVQVLLSRGATVEAVNRDGNRALEIAARSGRAAVVRVLLENGAFVDAPNRTRGYTALSTAALRGHIEVIYLLLGHGANVEAQSCIGDTPMLLAATRGRLEVRCYESLPALEGEGHFEIDKFRGALEDAPGQRFRGIEVELPSFQPWSDEEEEVEDNRKSPCQDLREALGLLAAVAHVDNAAYKKLLVENGKLTVGKQEEQFEGEVMPRFQLALVDNGIDGDGELLCTGSTEIEIPVSVQLGPWLTTSSQEMIAYLRKVQETIRTIRSQWRQYVDRDPPRLSVVFVLESITVDLRDIHISDELVGLVESLATDGIRLSGLALRQELGYQFTATENLEKAQQTVGKLMFGLFGGVKKTVEFDSNFDFEATSMTGPLAAEYGYSHQLAIASVHFDCEAMQNWVFERMCSAVAVSQTTKYLSLGLELDDGDSDGDDHDDGDWALCRWRWQWILFACFSERSRLHSRLKGLTLHNAVVTNEVVKAMAAVLASDAPEEGLLGELTLPPNGLAGVTSLTIEFNRDPDPEALQGMLLLVGASLTYLTLKLESFNTSELEGIVASCPNLIELAVYTHTIEMRFCLRDTNHRDLTLDSSSHLWFSWDIIGIAEALCDCENPLAKCTRRMRVRLDQNVFNRMVHPRHSGLHWKVRCVLDSDDENTPPNVMQGRASPETKEEARRLADKTEAEERCRQVKIEMDERARRDKEEARARTQELILLIVSINKKP
ncbi:hypothetical protein PInf_026270 [Phytophthora infestans]|nr:hypothetical protein PInf_026270 [Phytophthora infestans]